MKLRGEWLVLAERIINESLSDNLTLVSRIEQVGALQFPAQHHGFGVAARYVCESDPPSRVVTVHFRLVRCSKHEPDETLTEYDTRWQPGSRRGRIGTNFRFLRLRRPETLTFRMDHRVGKAAWTPGPSCSIDVVQTEITGEQRAAMIAELRARGLPTDHL